MTTQTQSLNDIALVQINTQLSIANLKLEGSKPANYDPQIKYYEGQICQLEGIKGYLSIASITDKENFIKYLDSLWDLSYDAQENAVGKTNNTGQPHLGGCFFMGKMDSIKTIKTKLK